MEIKTKVLGNAETIKIPIIQNTKAIESGDELLLSKPVVPAVVEEPAPKKQKVMEVEKGKGKSKGKKSKGKGRK